MPEPYLNILLIRHGETDFNVQRLFFGHSDIPLNKKGKKEAENLKNKLAERDIDIFYASPLSRASETAEIINKAHKRNIITQEGLKEINYGAWEGLSWNQISARYPSEWNRWLSDWESTEIPEGESFKTFYERITETLDTIIKVNPRGTVAIVTHSGVIRLAMAYYIINSINGYWKFYSDTGSYSEIRFSEMGAFLCGLNIT